MAKDLNSGCLGTITSILMFPVILFKKFFMAKTCQICKVQLFEEYYYYKDHGNQLLICPRCNQAVEQRKRKEENGQS
jgi:hypothetical protein